MSEYSYFLYSKLVTVMANVMVLAATVLGMYQASQRPEEGLSVFCSWFFSALPIILILAWAGHKYLRSRYHGPLETEPLGDA